jgi:hypothetical protein
VCNRDNGRSAIYSRVTDRKQGRKLFAGEHSFFWGHGLSMIWFGHLAWSILLK